MGGGRGSALTHFSSGQFCNSFKIEEKLGAGGGGAGECNLIMFSSKRKKQPNLCLSDYHKRVKNA